MSAVTTTVCPILVGRDGEMRALREALDVGGLVLVSGEAGIGKSRLVREFADSIRTRKRPVVWGRAESVSRAGPYSMVLDLCEDASVLLEDAAAEARELAALLMTLTAGSEPPARQVSARIRGLLARAGGDVVVVLEDLHFADELSLAVLAHLARSAADDGTLIIGTLRPAEAQHGPLARLMDVVTRDRIVTTVDLEPLSSDDVEAMVAAMWDRPPSPDDLAALTKLGEGVPFFVEELASARAAGHEDVPGTIARAVGARLDRLDERARAVIGAAALMSGALDPAVLSIVCEIPEREIPAHLIAAARAGLLADDEGHLVFRHALVRGSIAAATLSLERRGVHEKLARAIEHRYASDLDAHASALAHHWNEAGERRRAAEWWVVAGERALDAGALEEARASFDAARAADPEERLLLRAVSGIGSVASRMRVFDEAKSAFRDVADRYRNLGDAHEMARALMRLAKLAFDEYDGAGLSLLDEALGALPSDDLLAARLTIEKGFALVRAFDDHAAAGPLLREGLEKARRYDDSDSIALAEHGLAWVSEAQGDVVRANEHMVVAVEMTGRVTDLDIVTAIASDRALFGAQLGGCVEAIEIVQGWRDRFAGKLMSARAAALDHIITWLLWRRGMPAAAEHVALRLESTRWALLWGRVVRTWAAVERGDDDLARAILDSWWMELGDAAHRLHAMMNPDAAPLSEGYAALAETVFGAFSHQHVADETLGCARAYAAVEVPSPDVRLITRTLCARVMIRAGDRSGAATVVGEAEEFLASRPYPWHEASIAEVRGLLADDGALAAESFRRAAERFAATENLVDRARCLRHLAGWVQRDEGIEMLKEARQLASDAGAIGEQNQVESLLRAAGVRPRAGRPKGSKRPDGGLSSREQEVAVLVAGGSTNAEIAARLFLSERTVEDHIAKATRRIGVSGRAGLAAWAAKHGLI